MLLQGQIIFKKLKLHKIINVISKLVIILLFIEFLAPTFILAQYIISFGLTVKRLLGVCLCIAMWFSLLFSLFNSKKIEFFPVKWINNSLLWVCLCSLVALSYNPLYDIFRLSTWKTCPFQSLMLVAGWLIIIAPLICTIWVTIKIETIEANKDSGAVA